MSTLMDKEIYENFLDRKLKEIDDKVESYVRAASSPNTLSVYYYIWSKYTRWCDAYGFTPLPSTSDQVSRFIADYGSSYAFSTIASYLAAITWVHKQHNLRITGDPEIYLRIKRGIRRMHAENQSVRQAKALRLKELTEFCQSLGMSPLCLRDKALITVCFFGALRRSELVAINLEDVEFCEDGIKIRIVQSKTSDTAEYAYLSPTKDRSICPVSALKYWIAHAEITSGPVFRRVIKGGVILEQRLCKKSMSDIMKKYFTAEHSGHSPRRGLVTEAAEAGANIARIQKHSRHRSANMILRYIEHADNFKSTSTHTLGV